MGAAEKLEYERELAILDDMQHRVKARTSFLDFITYTKPDYKLWWHNKALAEVLGKFAQKEITRLIINMPPRHGKSEQVSRRLPAFLLGVNPDARIIAASYSRSLASRMNRDVQRIIDSKSYQRVFAHTDLMGPNMRTKPTKEWVRNNNGFEIVERKGVYLSVGRGAGVTGEGADYIIVDDPVKDAQEANSKTIRDATWEWWTTTLMTRGEESDIGGVSKDVGVLVTMTRWHHDDLVGRLQELERTNPDADKWTVFSLPATAEDELIDIDPREPGEALWPAKRDEKTLAKLKASLGTRVYNAMYQQKPSAGVGDIFKRSWFRFYKVLPEGIRQFTQSWDLSFDEGEKNDYAVGQLWGRLGPNYYLISQVRDKMGFTDQQQAIRMMSYAHVKALTKLVEKKANGAAIIDTLKREFSGLIAVEPKTSKIFRAEAASPLFEAGNVWLPDPSIAPWINDYIEELISFPRGSHDDQVDSSTQYLLWAANNVAGEYSQDMVQNKGKTIIQGGATW
jgi:predicted phage terminase large subunit-like protein